MLLAFFDVTTVKLLSSTQLAIGMSEQKPNPGFCDAILVAWAQMLSSVSAFVSSAQGRNPDCPIAADTRVAFGKSMGA